MSKRNTIALLGTLLLLGAGAALVYAFTSQKSDDKPLQAAYASEAYGIGFSYPASYLIDEQEVDDSVGGHYRIALYEDTEYARSVLSGTAPAGEAPPAITVAIYENPQGMTPEDWARSSQESNFQLSPTGTLGQTTVADQAAVTYEYDGLYRGESTVFAHNGYLVKVSADYLSPEDTIRADASTVLASFKLSAPSARPDSEAEVGADVPHTDSPSTPEETVACTMDAKICPDGSGVGRVPPSCAFAACPGETVLEARIDQGASGGGVKIVPLAVTEDSRCPADAVCVQAGTVRVRALVNETEQNFTLNQPRTIAGKTIELVAVRPYPYASQAPIAPSDYRFTFSIYE